jgi:tetratricopeptide (TPR) repeat protein
MIEPRIDSDDLDFIEKLILPSIVLIKVGGLNTQTGFFVSTQGDICTCYHGFFLREDEPIEIVWQGKSYHAHLQSQIKKADFALLRLSTDELGALKTPCLPVFVQPVDEQLTYHNAVTIGYAGLENIDLPVNQRLFTGRLGKLRTEGEQERIEFLDLGIGKGNSGAPIFDLEYYRVVGYIRTVTSKVQRLGDGLSLKQLIKSREDLAAQWEASGSEIDVKRVDYYLSERKSFSSSQLSPSILVNLITRHNRRLVNLFRLADAYIPELYENREAQEQVDDFLAQAESKILVLSGTTGSGKSNLLIHLLEMMDTAATIPVFINCTEVKEPNLLGAINTVFNINQYASGDVFPILRKTHKQWLLILDGFNEWMHANTITFKNLLKDLGAMLEQNEDIPLKIIIGVRSEFLQEKMPGFYFARGNLDTTVEGAKFVYRDEFSRRPYVEMRYIVEHDCAELERIYNHYYRIGAYVNSTGQMVGIRPKNSFAQLPDSIKRLLICPVVVKLFMIRYNNLEVPNLTLRSSFIDDILAPILPEHAKEDLHREEIYLFLMRFAYFIFRHNLGNPCQFSDLREQPWYSANVYDYLIVSGVYIQRRAVIEKGDLIERSEITFSTDWIFEYFLGMQLWQVSRRLRSLEERVKYFSELQKFSSETSIDAHLLGALLFIGEWALTKDNSYFDLMIYLINSTDWENFNDSFTHSYFDFIRTSSLFSEVLLIEGNETLPSFCDNLVRKRENFTEVGFNRILNFVEFLEKSYQTNDAFALLNLGQGFWDNTSVEAQNRLILSQAWNCFASHKIDETLEFAARVNFDYLTEELKAKYAFIVGRCYQFRQQYNEAITSFEKGAAIEAYFGYRCSHQIAFIEVIANSNYVKAAQLLEDLISKMSLSFSIDEQGGSRSLHAQCLKEIGKYTLAHNNLNRIVEIRSTRRNRHSYGRALRALGEVYLRQFNTPKAIEALNESIEQLEGVSYFLSKSYTLDIRALTYALLTGNFPAAYQDIETCLKAYYETKHTPGLAWSLQTKAFIEALDNKRIDAEKSLRLARDYEISPNQKLRETFIQFLARFVEADGKVANLINEMVQLRQTYLQNNYGWYPGLLALMLAAIENKTPQTSVGALDLFGEDIDADQMTRSYLYHLIFHEK